MELISFIFSDPLHFFGVSFLIMLILIGITEIIDKWKRKDAKKLIARVLNNHYMKQRQCQANGCPGHQPMLGKDIVDELENFIKH